MSTRGSTARRPERPPSPGAQARRSGASWVLPGLVVALAAALAAQRIVDTDLWLHLATGKWILENRAVPREEFYSFTAAGHKWVDLHWAYQVVSATVHRALGGVGLQLLHGSAILGGLLVLMREARRRGGEGIGWLFAGIAILTAGERFLCRPEAFTVLFLALAWMISERMLRGERPSYRWLLLQVAWANVQGLFILGPILFALRGAGAAIDRKLRRPGVAPGAVRRLGFASLLALVVSAVGPYHVEGLWLPFRLSAQVAGSSVYSAALGELLSPFAGRGTGALFVITGVVAVAAWVADRERRVADLLPMLFFGYLTFSARRNLLLFAAIVQVPTVSALGRLGAQLRPVPRRIAAAATGLVLVVAVFEVVGGRFYYECRLGRTTGFGFSERDYPVGATRYLESRASGGRVFNTLGDGDYLIAHLGPEWKVFFDGRAEVYGESLGRRLFSAYLDPASFEAACSRYSVDYLLIDTAIAFGQEFVAKRLAEGRWSLRFYDHRAAVLVRGEPDPRVMADAPPGDVPVVSPARALRPWTWRVDYPAELARLGRFEAGIGKPRSAARALMLASDRFRSSAELYNNYGAALLEASRYGPAAEAFEQALALDGDRETAAIGLARSLAAAEGPESAREQLSAWCRAHLEADRAWIALVRLNGKMGDASAALATANEHALRRPDSAARVAAALVEVGEREGATALLRAHLVRHPEDGSARALLGGIQSGRGAPETRVPRDLTPEGVAPPESTPADGAESGPARAREGASGGDR